MKLVDKTNIILQNSTMTKKTMIVSLVVLSISAINLFAQIPSALRGTYRLIAGYTYGNYSGLFCSGAATVSSSGVVAYSSYFAYTGERGYGSGTLNSSGAFSFNSGVSGTAQVYSSKVGYGVFYDSVGRGFFALGR